MITANDLKNMDYFLSEYSRISNHPEDNKKIAENLRDKISGELSEIKIQFKRLKKK